ncbi:hypothetical protein AB0A71_41290 [Kitasatospora aureofaciens]|uniref:hypothetical protein n=1 Tax=Kitasatospora aureofaciens TaxID=1894 RepID=UPI0033F5A382
MAVSIATDTVRAAASAQAYCGGEKLLTAGAVRNLEPGFGGANADVVDGTQTWQVWVGVVGRALAGECDCPDSRPTVLCPHTVAAALAAVRAGFTWKALPESRRDARTVDPVERRFRTLARTLDVAELVALIARHAVRDRMLSTDLEVVTGRLGAPGAEDLARLRALVDEARAIPDGRYGYDLHDVATAGRAVVAELQVLALRPPSVELLDAVEYAAERWDYLAGVLSQDWRTYDKESNEIGSGIAAVHVGLCERFRIDPAELVERLARLVAVCDTDSCLYPTGRYRHLLGRDGLEAFEWRRKELRGW